MSRILRFLKFGDDSCCWPSKILSDFKALIVALLIVFPSYGFATVCLPEASVADLNDITVECGTNIDDYDVTGFPVVDFNGCGELSIDATDSEVSSDGCVTVISRTWTVSVGGDVLATTVQLITIEDTTGPEITGVQPVIELQCNSLPEPDNAVAVDACGSASPVTSFTSQTGNLVSSCCLTTAYGPGSDWSIWLPLLSDGDCCFNSANWVFDGCGTIDQYSDGTAHIHGTIYNVSDPAQQFVVSMWLQNKSDWASWSAMGRGYRDDLGCASSGQFMDWNYWELVNGFSTLTGAGSLVGDILYLSHTPASYYFGFQAGQGANQRNCNDGLYGSFTYTGTIGGNELCCQHGDINVDMSNCEETFNDNCAHNTTYTRFYRASDDCGNVTTIAQEIVINDTTPPTFVNCPESVTIQCDEEIPAVAEDLVAIDNCEGDVVIGYLGQEEEIANDCYRALVRTWYAEDVCGNRAYCTQVITIIDTTAPVLSGLPEDAELTVECSDEIPGAPEVTVTDNCDENITFEYNEEIIEGDCPSNYTIVRTWSSVDNCENATSFTQTIHVQDTTAPVFDDYEIYSFINCEEEPAALTATDNCGEVTVTLVYDCYLAGGCLGMYYRIYEAVDECGNISSAEQFVAIVDNEAPVFQNVPEDATLECSDVSLGEDGNYFDDGGVYAIDNCGYHFYLECLLPLDYTYEEEVVLSEDCPQAFDVIRTWTATDYCGNVAEASQTVHVVDSTAPELSIPEDYTASCEDELVFDDASAVDNCGEASISVEQELIEGDCPNSYVITRTFVAVDECGNYSEPQVQTITVVDETAPEFGEENQSQFTYECDEEYEATQPIATDNCSEVISYEYVDGETWTEGCYSGFVRTWTATDECGNSSTFDQYINIQDTTAPVIYGDDVIELPCDDFAGIFVEAEDNCNEYEITIVGEEYVEGACAGTILRTYVATDVCGNVSDEFVQTINLVDEVAPVASIIPEDATYECDEEWLPAEVNFSDNCDTALVVIPDVFVATDGCTTTYTYTWIATDHCDNSTTVTQVITLIDTTNPWFENFPEDLTINCEDEVPAVVYPNAYDNCDEEVDIEVEDVVVPGECDNESVILRTFRAYDNCGNQVVETQTITIVDETAPVFSEENQVEFAYECNEEFEPVQPVATDNCSEELTYTYEDGNEWVEVEGCLSGFTRTWTATDDCGNSSSFEQYILIQDTTAPVVDDYEIELTMACDQIDASVLITATDNCNDVTITYDDEHVSGGCAGKIIRTYHIQDACGNVTEGVYQQIITLIDTVAPTVAVLPVDLVVECDEEIPGYEPEWSDNCTSELILEAISGITPEGCEQIISQAWTATDECGNSTTVSRTITIVDTTAPVASFEPEDFTVECGSEYDIMAPTFSDNCDEELELTSDVVETTNGCTTWVTWTWTATDDCGNTTTVEQVVTIEDTTAPVIEVPEGGEFSCDEDIEYGEASASDICSDVQLSYNDEIFEGDCPQSYSIVRTWTAADACGNTSSASATYWVYDLEAPEFTSVPEDITVECSDDIPGGEATAVDNCSEDVTITMNEEWEAQSDCYSVLIRTWTATDECGNSSYASQVITIVDTTAPTITGDAEVEMPCDDIDNSIHESIVATDNCDTNVEIEIVSDEYVSGDCAGKIIRTYRAYDNCQNYSDFVQFINLIDETAPVASENPEDATYECDEEWSPADVTFTDNCDDELSLFADAVITFNGCTRIHTYTWSATDHCGNTTVVTQVITVVDTTAPVIDSEDSESTVECNMIVDFVFPTATDNCDDDVEVTLNVETVEGECAGEFTEFYTFTATDDCGNSSSVTYTVHHIDTTPPVLENIPASNELSCSAEIPNDAPTAYDNCSEATVHSSEAILPGECPNSYVIVRTFWATDECGNSSDEVTVSYYIYDNEAPVFDFTPEDENYECIDWESYVPQDVTATDYCGEASVEWGIEPYEYDNCGNGMWEVFYTATDDCGNSSSTSYFIYVQDESAPVLSEYPANLVLDCGTELPGAPEITATDNCDEYVEVSMTETCLSGDCPEVGSTPPCVLKTPARPASNPCVYPYDWAMALFAMPNAHRWYQLVEGSGSMVHNGDGSVTLSGRLINATHVGLPAADQGGFDFIVTFDNELDWIGWSSQAFPTGFKADCGGLGANHEDWLYYIMQNTAGYELIGWGVYAGSEINLTHAPTNNYFGFQYGEGANNYNASNGFGGWFNYHGTFLVNGEPIMSGMAAGAGDFAFEIDCCIEYDLQRCWTAEDCSGNEVSWCQIISYRDMTADGENSTGDMILHGDDMQIAIVAMAPNPTTFNSEISFTSTESERLSLQVLDMTGRIVADLFEGEVIGGELYKVTFNAKALQAGIYVMRLSSDSQSDVKRIQVVR